MSAKKRHTIVYHLLRPLLKPYLKLRLNYSCSKSTPKSKNYIVLSNHTLDLDPLLISASFKKHMYFISDEHIFRWGIFSKLLSFFFDPIPWVRDTIEITATRELLARLKNGANICMFCEVSIPFDGVSSDFSNTVGKLVKHANVGLITYRITGGYFTKPRWSKHYRKGTVSGSVVNEYTPEMLQTMSVSQINQAIRSDIFVNAFQDTKNEFPAYHGKNPAQDLELCCYLCPNCFSFHTMHSDKNKFFCSSCGLSLTVSATAELFSQNNLPFKLSNVLEWMQFQTRYLEENFSQILIKAENAPLLSNYHQIMYTYTRAGESTCFGKGILSLFPSSLVFKSETDATYSFPIKEIKEMAVHGKNALMFSLLSGKYYEVYSGDTRSATAYVDLFHLLKQSNKKEELPT